MHRTAGTSTRILVPLKSPTVVSLRQNSELRKRMPFPVYSFYVDAGDCCCEGASHCCDCGLKLLLWWQCDCSALVTAAVAVGSIPVLVLRNVVVDVQCWLWWWKGCCWNAACSYCNQCCGFGMFYRIPDHKSDFFPFRIPDPNFFHPGSGSRIRIKEFKYLTQRNDF